MLGWMKLKVESRLPWEITSDKQMSPLLIAESEEELKICLIRMKKESEKSDLKLSIQKMKITASGPIASWQ